MNRKNKKIQATDDFTSRVLTWFDLHGRKDLPWQINPSPYRVWVSEIMLQQTQVQTVIPYYAQFMAHFPDIQSLAAASRDEVLSLWSGLGYYARARNLHQAARTVIDIHGGVFPDNFEQVLMLPGIGRSTAGAILSLSANRPFAILDGNVKRVLCRFHGVEGWPGQAAVNKRLWYLAEQFTSNEKPAKYNQAMMDLGATLCTRRKPRCTDCPLRATCYAFQEKVQHDYPASKPKKTIPVKTTVMVMLHAHDKANRVLLEQRPPTGIWGGLWSFPELRKKDDLCLYLQKRYGQCHYQAAEWPTLRHTFSHFHLDITPIKVVLYNPTASVMEENASVWYKTQPESKQRLGLAAPVKHLLGQLEKELRST